MTSASRQQRWSPQRVRRCVGPRICRRIFCQCCMAQRRWEVKERQKWNDTSLRASSSRSRASETYVNWFKSIVVELNNSKTMAAAAAAAAGDDWLTDRHSDATSTDIVHFHHPRLLLIFVTPPINFGRPMPVYIVAGAKQDCATNAAPIELWYRDSF